MTEQLNTIIVILSSMYIFHIVCMGLVVAAIISIDNKMKKNRD